MLVVCLVIVLASGALANGGSGLGSASDTLTKQGASGQTYVWQSGSC